MLTHLNRSRAHTALTHAWESAADPRYAAYATALVIFADRPELPAILILADLIQSRGDGVQFDLFSIEDVTGLSREACEVALAAGGAHEDEDGIRFWKRVPPGGTCLETFVLTDADWQAWIRYLTTH